MEKLTTQQDHRRQPDQAHQDHEKKSASICGAIFEASGGNSAKFVNT